MPYRFATGRQDYSDFSSGRVFYNLPRRPAFPIRLTLEVFQRCLSIRSRQGRHGPVTLYDPCCGGAYPLAVLPFFQWDSVAGIIASDIDPEALSIARKNLSLLTLQGIELRRVEIARLADQFGKTSHADALRSTAALKARLEENLPRRFIPTRLFQANALDPAAIPAALAGQKVEVVFADLPYGIQSSWQFASPLPEGSAPSHQLLETLAPILAPQAVLAIASTREDKVSHPAYTPAGKLKLGHRVVVFLQPV